MKKLIISAALGLVCTGAQCEVAVIVNPGNGATIDVTAIKQIYLGKAKSFADGSAAKPVSQEENTVTGEFNEKVIGKSSSQLNAYWSKLVFTGKGTPPDKLANDAAVIDFVAANTDAIGYIDSSKASDKVKIVATF